MKPSIGAADAMMLTTERADDIVLIPTNFKDSLATFFFGVEVSSEFVDAVEVAEIYHIPHV